MWKGDGKVYKLTKMSKFTIRQTSTGTVNRAYRKQGIGKPMQINTPWLTICKILKRLYLKSSKRKMTTSKNVEWWEVSFLSEIMNVQVMKAKNLTEENL